MFLLWLSIGNALGLIESGRSVPLITSSRNNSLIVVPLQKKVITSLIYVWQAAKLIFELKQKKCKERRQLFCILYENASDCYNDDNDDYDDDDHHDHHVDDNDDDDGYLVYGDDVSNVEDSMLCSFH